MSGGPMLGSIDMGGTKTIVAVVEAGGRIVAQREAPTPQGGSGEVLRQVAGSLLALAAQQGVKPAAVGVCCNGVTNAATGVLLHAPHTGWQNVPVAALVAGQTGLPAAAANDCEACALAELAFGAGRQYQSFLWATVSTGVGAAVVASGRVLPGSHGMAGELGHIKVEYTNPRPCECGQQGCVEAYASGTAIAAAAQQEALANPAFAAALAATEESGAKAVAALAAAGNADAQRLLAAAGMYLGRALAAAANVLDADAIILGGGVMEALPLLRPHMEKELRAGLMPALPAPPLVHSKLGYHAAVYGGAALALRRLNGEGVQHE